MGTAHRCRDWWAVPTLFSPLRTFSQVARKCRAIRDIGSHADQAFGLRVCYKFRPVPRRRDRPEPPDGSRIAYSANGRPARAASAVSSFYNSVGRSSNRLMRITLLPVPS